MNLVTGATGIIGSHVVLELLKRGQPVTACRQPGSDLSKIKKLFAYYDVNNLTLFQKIKWVEVDILDVFSIEEALEGVSNVYHCAGFVSFLKTDRKKLMAINETGTANVVTACQTKKISALCHVSSIGAINNLDHTDTLHEGVFWKTSGQESDYAISKYNGERQVWRGIEEGLNAVVVNPGVVLSPGFWEQSSSKLFDTCYKGTRFYTSGITAYVAAQDVARIMAELLEKRHFGERYVIVEGNYSFQHILGSIHRGLGRKEPSVNAGRWLLQLGKFFEGIAVFFTGKEQRITSALIHSAFRQQKFRNDKVVKTLNYHFKSVDETISEICQNYLFEKDPANQVANGQRFKI